MTVEQIARLVAAGESETLEFKSSTGTRREATQTICAMLNHQGAEDLNDRQKAILDLLKQASSPLALREILPNWTLNLMRDESGRIWLS